MKILALGAHPDDIEIYLFGTLCAYAEAGAELVFAIATDGARGGTGDPEALSRTRKAEASAAASLLGVVPRFLDLPDGGLVADAALIGGLKALITDTLPDLVITHAPNDYHGDHRALAEAARIATSFTAPLLYADTMGGVGFVPSYYVDVTAHFPRKAEAIRAHVSQEPERFVVMAEKLNGFRAGQCNAGDGQYAEAFRFEPIYPFADIRGLLPPPPKLRPVGNRALAKKA